MNTTNKYFVGLLAILFSSNLFAHEGHDESKAQTTETSKYFSIESSSDKYEVLLRYEPIEIDETVQLTLFLSDYTTNRPINKAKVKIYSQEDAKMDFKIEQKAEGTYSITTKFSEKKDYSLSIDINGDLGPDLILITGIHAGRALDEETGGTHKTTINIGMIGLFMLTLLVGVGLGFLIQKRKSARSRSVISGVLLFLSLLSPVENSFAHEGHEHATEKPTSNLGNSFLVPKETQFLFDVFTEKVESGNFSESTKLFGTITPGMNGQALVSTPQSGKIVALNVHVAEEVKAGQLLALVEQNIDAGTQINLLAEKNNLTAEYEAAKKEYERIKSIQDIAAKKDLDEALARLRKAENNLALFNSNSGKTIGLYAPIRGTVSNFKLSLGSTVNSGQILFTINNLANVYAEVQVFDRDVSKVKQGTRFLVECANDSHKTSEVKLLSFTPEINSTNQSQKVLFELDNSNAYFKMGEFVNIRVFSHIVSRQIALPNSAITEIDGKPVVFIKNSAEKYTVSYVQLGENNGTFTTILKGVSEEQRVVVNATYQLKMIYLNQ